MRILFKAFTFFVFLISYTSTFAQTNWGEQLSDAIIDRWPNSINDMTGKQWEYSNSIVLHGIEKVYKQTGNQEYLNYIKNYVDDFVDANGNISWKSSANNLDFLHPGLLLLFLYQETGEVKYKTAAEKVRTRFDSHPTNASGGFWHKDNYPNQMWCDGIYMAEPFLIKYGQMFDDTAYCNNQAVFQTLLLAEHAYDSTTQLLVHGWDETKSAFWADQSTGLSPEIWSRAMGWYAMAMVDILDYLPETNARYNEMITLAQNIAEGLKNSQDETTGLWYQVVDKGSEAGNWIETSGSGMYIYFLKHAVDSGYIDDSYSSVAEIAWAGLQNYITLDNQDQPVISDYVGGMGILDSYASYIGKRKETCPPSVHPHGYCAFLMASSAMDETNYSKKRNTSLTVEGNGSVEFIEGATVSDSGSVITLVAIPDYGYSFEGFTGDLTETNDTLSFGITENTNLVATFEPIPGLITVFQAEAGSWNEGTVVENEHTGFTGTGYVNTTNEVGSYMTIPVLVDEHKLYTFGITYANGSTDRPVSVSVGDDVSISSVSLPGTGDWTSWGMSTFDIVLDSGSYDITLTSTESSGAPNIDKLSIEAKNELPTYSLTISTKGDGYVTSNPAKITYEHDTQVAVTAVANNTYKFMKWEGDITGSNAEENIIMNDDKTITAIFRDTTINVFTLEISQHGLGSISLDPDINEFDSASVVKITASPESGYEFAGWTGDVESTSTEIDVTMDSDKTIEANVEEITIPTYSLNISIEGMGSVLKSPNASTYDSSSTVTISATPDEGYVFTGYSGDLQSTQNTVNITIDQEFNITATFELIDEIQQEFVNKVELYPNPVTENLIIKTSEDIEKLEILDLHGRILETIQFPEGSEDTYTLNLNYLDRGSYFIRIIQQSNIQVKRIVKN